MSSEIALGSRDIYVQPELMFYFGRRNNTAESIAFDRIGSTTKELYFALGGAYRYVGYNGIIEGNAFGDDSNFLVESSNDVYTLKFDVRHRFGRNDYIVGYRFITSETAEATDHQYLTLTYARSF